MKRLSSIVLASIALLAFAAPTVAHAEFGVESFEARVETEAETLDTRAGAHPFAAKGNFLLNTAEGGLYPSGRLKDLTISLPAGFIGNPEALPKCTRPEFLNLVNAAVYRGCRPESQVGTVTVVELDNGRVIEVRHPVYNLEPEEGDVADFGFMVAGVPVHLVPRVRDDGDYGLDLRVTNASTGVAVRGSYATFWGYPMDPVHDSQRSCDGGDENLGCASAAPRHPFLTNPSVCGPTFDVGLAADSWLDPGNFKSAAATLPAVSGCGGLPFEPTLAADPGTRQADAPASLAVDLAVPQVQNPDGLATPPLKKVAVQFPKGVAIAPPSADGLQGCSDAALSFGSSAEPSCSTASKIGSLSLVTPLLAKPLAGDVILRDPRPGELFRLALVIRGPGFTIKLPGKATPDPQTGQLSAVFDDNPQLPFSSLHLELKSGSRAPLSTPEACGTYTTRAELTSWARPNEPVLSDSTFTIDEGCKQSQFAPGFEAGVANAVAGASSGFSLRVTRGDGEQNVSRIEATLPEGLLAKLAGVPLCGEAQAATGNCPQSTQIGTTTVGVGAGSNPLYVPQPGKAPTAVYLAGPYKGEPYSLVVKVPAQAGPFDLGTVAVRSTVSVDPVSAAASVSSDPLPQILEGVPIAYRDVRVDIDRGDFIVNPTACKPTKVSGAIASSKDRSANVSDRFQVTNCAALGFKPSLKLKVSGATKRGKYPKLRAELKAPAGQANIGKVSVALPHSEFLAQEHIKTICTRVQYSANGGGGKACPPGSVYGWARAFTPLLDQPLEGPVFLRSSSNPLPDLVASLDGQIHIDLAGRIDSVNGGIRNTFESVPDAPVSRFVLSMKGGKKSLLVNSRNLCATKNRATVKMDGQNGKVHDFRPLVGNSCGKARKR